MSTILTLNSHQPGTMKQSNGFGKLPEECQVCGTNSNVRKNFGVPSCVSCRIFYSRNTGKHLICYQNGNCRIEGPSRKSCAACRFQKCMRSGMQKSRERKYKYNKKNSAVSTNACSTSSDSNHQSPQSQQQSPQQLQQQQKGSKATPSKAKLQASTSEHPPLELFREIGGMTAPVMDKNMFVHFYKMADMFKVPFECDSQSLMVTDTPSGLCLLEAVTKRTLAIIRFLPYFGQLDRSLVSAMVSEKISGLISILRTLHYQPSNGLMTIRCARGFDSATPPPTPPLTTADESLQQPLMQVINGLFVDLTKGVNPLMTDAEVATVYLAALRLYDQCHSLFRDRLNIGVILMLGMYFFLPDYKTVQLDEVELRGYQKIYLRCLQDLLKVLSSDPSEAMDMYNRILFLLTEVKTVDFYLSLLSRHVRV